MSRPSSFARLVERRDVQIWLVVLTVIGLVGSFAVLPEDYSVGRKVAAGFLFGIGSAFCVVMPRMIGGHDYN